MKDIKLGDEENRGSIIKQNFLSVDGKSARNSYDEYFTIGDTVEHDDNTAGTATISSFELDIPMNEVKAFTEKGYAHIDFITRRLIEQNE